MLLIEPNSIGNNTKNYTNIIMNSSNINHAKFYFNAIRLIIII